MVSLVGFLNSISTLIIYSLAILIPVAFTPLTTEFYDTTKLIVTALAVLLLLLTWGLRLLTENKIIIVKTPLDLLLLIFLVTAVLSTVLSSSPYLSVYGQLPRVFGSLLFLVVNILLYFMIVSNLRGIQKVSVTTNLMVISGILVSLSSLLSYFKFYLPWAPLQNQSFSLAGTPYSASMFLAILLPVILSYLLRTAALKSLISIFYAIALLLFSLTIILVGNMAAWVGALLAIAFSLWQNRLALHLLQIEQGRKKIAFKGSAGILIAVGVIALFVAILSYTPTLKNTTILGQTAYSFNREIQLPVGISWKISASSFRDSPILGTGPATYLHNFTAYKPVEYNQTPFWNLRIPSAHNQYLQTWSELGGAGILVLLIIATTFSFYAFRHKDELGLWLSGVVFFVMMAFSPMNVITFTTGIIMIALFMSALRSHGQNELIIDLAAKNASEVRGTHILIPSLIFLPLVILIVSGFYFFGKLAIGEYFHRQALNAISTNRGLDTYNGLVAAEKINPQADLYRVDLAQTNFALANAIAAQKGPTEASPGGSLTDSDRQNIRQLLQQAIAEGKAAVALSPRSAANWEILALIYRQVSGVAENALTYSLDSYGRAIQRDPYNPMLRVAVGGVYYQAKNYDLAIRFFDDAVSLKPDYANALYNLAVALRDKGNFAEGITITERLVAQLQDKQDSNDYKLATQLLSELKEKAPATTQPTSASPSAALENTELPNVLDEDLDTQPEDIATPPAIQR
jgi:tetratricopeptide (TPR) repeat protein/O-antigen ligase